ncbi:hypothetical protein J1N35_028381 [Gossypium stocksii]|uniref:Uncharacterized protein n=1 Tax=Gossypium stocksii TaxID=47602 RepID=A0A9D3UXT0_9ROSI|nr:hypothetical protein J1N35_028381 [Gossypium stocksii]
MNVQALAMAITKLKSVMLTVIPPSANLIVNIVNQTVMVLDQLVTILVSLVVMAVCFISMERAISISVWCPIPISKSMVTSSVIDPLIEPGTSLGFKRLASYSTLILSPLKPSKLQHGTMKWSI